MTMDGFLGGGVLWVVGQSPHTPIPRIESFLGGVSYERFLDAFSMMSRLLQINTRGAVILVSRRFAGDWRV